jgi:diguanylate cyclase (GGDEF)-like protein/PAS domain S-box-containing protein
MPLPKPSNRTARWFGLVVLPALACFFSADVLVLRLMIWAGAGIAWMLLHYFERTQRRADIAFAKAASQQRFAAFLQHSSDVVTVLDADGIVRYESPSAKRVFGYEPGEMLGTELKDLLHGEDRRRVFEAVIEAAAAGNATGIVVEARVRHADGSWRHTETSVSSLLDDPDVQGVILNTRDITERKELEAALSHQAFHDSLTKLPNRALLKDRIDHAVARAARRQRALAVLLLDLDGFKAVNDSLGHAAGDELLTAVADRLADCIRPTDTCARLGGDEFAILLEDLASPNDWQVVANRMLEALRRPFGLNGKEVFVRASIGVAMRGEGGEDADELLRNADVAMYMAKSQGKNRFEAFCPTMHSEMLRRLDLEADLRRAIEAGGEMVLHYQPTVVLQTGEIAGVEALVRWNHPERGLIPPLEFIPVAEETGLIVQLGEWVLREACMQAVAWDAAATGITRREPPMTMSVNLSARQLQHESLVASVRAVLDETGLEPSRLILEITETAVMNDHVSTIVRLQQLKDLGVGLAIDDFGTGYSSLAYLRRFPIDVLKIDRSFVDGVTEGSQKAALLRTIVELGRTLNLKTVAEGIEEHEELDQLRSLECDLGQGYFFARPLGADVVGELLRHGQLRPDVAVVGDDVVVVATSSSAADSAV